MKKLLACLLTALVCMLPCMSASAEEENIFFESVFLNRLELPPQAFLESSETRAFFSVAMCMDVMASSLNIAQEELTAAIGEKSSYTGSIDLGNGDVGAFLYLHLEENDWLFNYFIFGDTGYVLYSRYDDVYPEEAVLLSFLDNEETFGDVLLNDVDAILLASQAIVDAMEQ